MSFKKNILIIFFIQIISLSMIGQTVFSPTVACSGITKEEKFNVYATLGETISGCEKINNHIFIEGFYFTFDFYSKVVKIDEDLNKFSVFPNPSKKIFNIENKSNLNAIIDILNISGQEIKTIELESNKISTINDLHTGVYLIEISDKKGNKIGVLKQIII